MCRRAVTAVSLNCRDKHTQTVLWRWTDRQMDKEILLLYSISHPGIKKHLKTLCN